VVEKPWTHQKICHGSGQCFERFQPPRSDRFLYPASGFNVARQNGRLFLDQTSFARYDPVVLVFTSLNTEGCVKTYRKLEPYFQLAYRDLGYPTRTSMSFD